jgi:hypothetical protein
MNRNFLYYFYGTLFTPEKAFGELKENPPIVHSVAIIILISMLKVLLYSDTSVADNPFLYGTTLLFSAFWGIIGWLFFAGFFEVVATVFDKGGRYKTLLVLSAYALLPCIFFAPVEIFKMLDSSVQTGGVFLGIIVWIWSMSLQFYAILKTYELSLGKTAIFVFIPSLAWFICFNWFVGFFTSLGQIFGS